jgi:hypothetical protein
MASRRLFETVSIDNGSIGIYIFYSTGIGDAGAFIKGTIKGLIKQHFGE